MSSLLLTIVLALPTPGAALSPADAAAVRELDRKYVEGWLAGDPEAVLSVFVEDAVIIPSGMQPIRGHEAMRGFWWPDDGSTTVIDSYETRIDEVRGSNGTAWAWGTGRLVFTWEKDGQSSVHTSDSVFTMVAQRDSRGSWKMTHRTWSDVKPRASLLDRAREFRSLVESKQYEAARAMMGDSPRRWWEAREGEGRPWNVAPGSPGPWAAWDDHFGSEKEIVCWIESDRSVTAIVRETNDYFRLLERDAVLNEITYFFDGEGRIDGLLIAGVGDRPPGRTEEFREWARVHTPEELAAVMPGGEIDPSDPPRFRALLERWRAAVDP